jgi:hypothetical protein
VTGGITSDVPFDLTEICEAPEAVATWVETPALPIEMALLPEAVAVTEAAPVLPAKIVEWLKG